MAQNIATTNYHDRVQALFENVQILRDTMKNFAATFNRPAEATQATQASQASQVKTAEPTVNHGIDAQALAASIDIPVPTKTQAAETVAPVEPQNDAAKVVAGIDIDALLAGTNLDQEVVI